VRSGKYYTLLAFDSPSSPKLLGFTFLTILTHLYYTLFHDFLGRPSTSWAETFWADFLGKAGKKGKRGKGKKGLAQKVGDL